MTKREEIIRNYESVFEKTNSISQKLSIGFVIEELKDDVSSLSLFIDEMTTDLKAVMESSSVNDVVRTATSVFYEENLKKAFDEEGIILNSSITIEDVEKYLCENDNALRDYCQNHYDINDIYSVSDIMDCYNDLVNCGEIDISYLLKEMDEDEILNNISLDKIIEHLKYRCDIYDVVSIDWDR